MKESTKNTQKTQDLENPEQVLNLVILPKKDIIEMIKALDGLKRKLKPLLDKIA